MKNAGLLDEDEKYVCIYTLRGWTGEDIRRNVLKKYFLLFWIPYIYIYIYIYI